MNFELSNPPRLRPKYKIRKLVANSKQGSDVFGITIPLHIADQFSNTFFRITVEDSNIILQSGSQPQRRITVNVKHQ